MKKMLKGFFILVLVVIIVLVLIITLFFGWNSYTSPVREAGREYKRTVRSYRNDEIESMDDVYERIAFLEKHYNSPTHSKMQGGEKTKITPTDIETMFGEADAVYEDVEKGYGKADIYQYKYGAETLSFHNDWEGVTEFILENYSGEIYEPEEMDSMFFKVIEFHQANYEEVEGEYELFSEADISSYTAENEPTRTIKQDGWFTWPLNYEIYYDDGHAKMSPEEFLMLGIEEDEAEKNVLGWLDRRYRDAYVEITDQEVVEEKIGTWNEWNRYFQKIKDEALDDIVTVQDLADDYGEITRLTYNFRTGILAVNWLIMEPDQMALEISANIPMSIDNVPTKKEDIYAMHIKFIESERLFRDDSILRTDDFIGQ